MSYSTPTCPIARDCGGCEWLAVPYPLQLKRKSDFLHQLFDKMLIADKGDFREIAGMEDPIHFRHKAATPFAPGKRYTPTVKGKELAPRRRILSGFYAAGSHNIVACKQCLVEHPRCREVLNFAAKQAEKLGIPAFEEDRHQGLLRHAIVRVGLYSNEALLVLVLAGKPTTAVRELADRIYEEFDWVCGVVANINTRRTNAMLGKKNMVLAGRGVMHDQLLACDFYIGATSFYQTNPKQTELLYKLGIEAAKLQSSELVLDAYSGIGTIGICAARLNPGIEVISLETGEEASRLCLKNAAANGLERQVHSVCSDASDWMRQQHEKNFSTVIMDPPRAGSTEQFLSGLHASKAEKLVYISCNAQTLARDLEFLRARGWRLKQLQGVDLFAHTPHIEAVCLLKRR